MIKFGSDLLIDEPYLAVCDNGHQQGKVFAHIEFVDKEINEQEKLLDCFKPFMPSSFSVARPKNTKRILFKGNKDPLKVQDEILKIIRYYAHTVCYEIETNLKIESFSYNFIKWCKSSNVHFIVRIDDYRKECGVRVRQNLKILDDENIEYCLVFGYDGTEKNKIDISSYISEIYFGTCLENLTISKLIYIRPNDYHDEKYSSTFWFCYKYGLIFSGISPKRKYHEIGENDGKFLG